jgi:hypothetical protein
MTPGSHKVIFENEFIRVLQVTLPPAGHAEPMHFHRWPSLFIGYDTGGTTAHIRYHTADGKVRDQPSKREPVHPGEWGAAWMKPEPMHSIEVVENAKPGPAAFPAGCGWRLNARDRSSSIARNRIEAPSSASGPVRRRCRRR